MKYAYYVIQLLSDGSYAIGIQPNNTVGITEWFYQEFAGSNFWVYYDAYRYSTNQTHPLNGYVGRHKNGALTGTLENVPWDVYRSRFDTYNRCVIVSRDTMVPKYYRIPSYAREPLEDMHRQVGDPHLMFYMSEGHLDKLSSLGLDVELVSGDFLFERQ